MWTPGVGAVVGFGSVWRISFPTCCCGFSMTDDKCEDREKK